LRGRRETLATVIACLAGVGGATPSAAEARSNFGGAVKSDFANARGVRASIRHGTAGTPSGSNGFSLMRVVLQARFGEDDPGLIQTGFYRQYGTPPLDLSCIADPVRNFWEYENAGGAYICSSVMPPGAFYSGAGNTQLYTVQREAGTTSGWGAWIAGTKVLSVPLNFGHGGPIGAGGEYQGPGDPATAGTVTGMTYGAASQWAVTSQTCCSGWANIGSYDQSFTPTDGRWTVSPFPQPFAVGHP
jgi:hypothetical protein